MTDNWLSIAIRRDGPDFKQGYGHIPARTLGEIQGVCVHSMEGSLAAAMGELDNPDRMASWTFSNPKAGQPLQHYPLQSVTWGSGSPEANRLFVSVEHEGVAGEPLTDSQKINLVHLIEAVCSPPYQRNVNLWEHREMAQFGAQPTACPSDRIDWPEILTILEENGMVTQEDIDRWNNTDIAIKAVLANFADTDNAIKTLLWQIDARLKVLEKAAGVSMSIDTQLKELDARLDAAAKALSG